jgi:hypothetical protein
MARHDVRVPSPDAAGLSAKAALEEALGES